MQLCMSRPKVDVVVDMLMDGMKVSDIATKIGVSDHIVSVIEHTLVVRGEGLTQLERLADLAVSADFSLSNIEVKDYAAKQLGKWLIQAGMLPAQVHISTGLSIHKCRHLYRQVRLVFQTATSVIPMPQTLSARLVMSIFSAHYLFLQKQSDDSMSVQIPNVVVAWTRTIDEVYDSRIDLMDDFDPRIMSLGSLFEIARSLREVLTTDSEKIVKPDGKRSSRFVRSTCPECGCSYMGFISPRRVKSRRCCFCEITNDVDEEMEQIAENERREAKRRRQEARKRDLF